MIIKQLTVENGGAMRDRTADLLRARQALSQLSYSPRDLPSKRILVGLGGFEPPTSPLSGVRSNQLSYRPIKLIYYADSVELLCLSSKQFMRTFLKK